MICDRLTIPSLDKFFVEISRFSVMTVVEWFITSARQEEDGAQSCIFIRNRSFAQQNFFHGVMSELNGKIQWGLTIDIYTIDVDSLMAPIRRSRYGQSARHLVWLKTG